MLSKPRTGFVSLVLASALAVAACPGTSEETPTNDAGASSSGGDGGPQAAGCGRNTSPCGDGEKCEGAPDCLSQNCREGRCRSVAPANGIKDGDETDVDCGGTNAPACADGKQCKTGEDCTSALCKGGVCAAPSPTDGIKNGDETDVDCGGAKAPKCATGKGCKGDTDCNKAKCNAVTKTCDAPSATDGIQNGDETDIDCGGGAPNRCEVGKGCKANTDCNKVACDVGATNKCLPPSKTDGIQNGTETDVDCGGGAPTNAPACAAGKACTVHGDCASDGCRYDKKCAAVRSCTPHEGGDTCGKRESNDATRVHEDCCRTLPLPTLPAKLDKYEVTAGRFRQFVERVGPNMRAWAKAEIANGTPIGTRLQADLTATMIDLLPASATPGDPLNMVQQIGFTVMDSRVPSMVQGCFNNYDVNDPNVTAGAYGANTYYWDAAVLRAHSGDPNFPARRFTKAQYDEKPMNCGAYWMYAAFCAWDGGRMPTTAEMNDAWGPTNYPWGTATFSRPTNPGQGPYQYEDGVNYFNNANIPPNNVNYFYHFPGYGNAADLAGLIAAPGRFILDATIRTGAGESWMDLGANVMELTRYGGGSNRFCDFSITNAPGDVIDTVNCIDKNDKGETIYGVVRATGLPNSVWVGGSWEGHQQFTFNTNNEPWFNKASYNLPTHTQYGKTGLRCAR